MSQKPKKTSIGRRVAKVLRGPTLTQGDVPISTATYGYQMGSQLKDQIEADRFREALEIQKAELRLSKESLQMSLTISYVGTIVSIAALVIAVIALTR